MSEKRDNRWTGGPVNLNFGELPSEDRGRSGSRFMEVSFTDTEPPEVFLLILEERPWAQQYGMIKALDLVVSTLLVNTDCGPVAMAIWRLADRGNIVVHYEHPMDPFSPGLPTMLGKIEAQSRLKVVMRDNQTGETTGFWEFDNNFRIGEFRELIGMVQPRGDTLPLPARVDSLFRQYRVEDLIGLAERRQE